MRATSSSDESRMLQIGIPSLGDALNLLGVCTLLLLALTGCGHKDAYSRETFNFQSYSLQDTIGFYTQEYCEELQVDHVVSLKDAWDTGAKFWSNSARENFANDRRNHVPACTSVNQSKGSAEPLLFKKRSEDGSGREYRIVKWCEYLSIYVDVKKKYDLQISKRVVDSFSRCDLSKKIVFSERVEKS